MAIIIIKHKYLQCTKCKCCTHTASVSEPVTRPRDQLSLSHVRHGREVYVFNVSAQESTTAPKLRRHHQGLLKRLVHRSVFFGFFFLKQKVIIAHTCADTSYRIFKLRQLSWIHTFWLHQRAYTRVCATLGNTEGQCTIRPCLIRPKPDLDFKIRILKPWGCKQTECWIRIRFLENKCKICI